MSKAEKTIFSRECFTKYGEQEIKTLGELKVIEKYWDTKNQSDKIDKKNSKVNPKEVNVYLLNIKEENNVWVADYRYTCVVKTKTKPYTTIENDCSFYFTLKENELSSSRYRQMSVHYFYLLYNLDGKTTYTEVINTIHGMSTGGVTYQSIYFSLKYCYEYLQNKISEDFDYTACKKYRYRGLGCYTQGIEWGKFFEKINQEYFKSKRNSHQEIIAQELLWLHKEYGYTYEDISMALEYIYKVLEKPIPDKPSLRLIPNVMQDAKVKIQEAHDRQMLIDYIYKLFDLEEGATYPLIQAEVRKYHSKEYGSLTYKGMLSTLDYYYNIMENPLPQVPNVGIIPYQYNNALAFYMQRKAVKESGKLPNTVPVVRISVSKEARIKSQQLYEDRYKWKPTKLISEIEVGEDETFDRL